MKTGDRGISAMTPAIENTSIYQRFTANPGVIFNSARFGCLTGNKTVPSTVRPLLAGRIFFARC